MENIDLIIKLKNEKTKLKKHIKMQLCVNNEMMYSYKTLQFIILSQGLYQIVLL